MKYKISIEITDEQIEAFCRGHYFCDEEEDDEGNLVREKWQPFEYEDDDWIEEQIDNDIWAIKRFLGIADKGRFGGK